MDFWVILRPIYDLKGCGGAFVALLVSDLYYHYQEWESTQTHIHLFCGILEVVAANCFNAQPLMASILWSSGMP